MSLSRLIIACAIAIKSFIFLVIAVKANDIDIPVRGVIIATKEATVSASINSPVLEINGRVGGVFKQGDVLISFDCGLIKSQRKSAVVDLKIAQAEHKNNLQMKRRGAIAGHEVILSKFNIEKANATIAEYNEQLKHCEISAPFNGSFEAIDIKLLQVPASGAQIMKLVSQEDFEVELILPSTSLEWIKMGARFQMNVEELGRKLGGKVVRIGSRIDPVSQTFNAYGVLTEDNIKLIPGMSGLVEMQKLSN